MDTNIQKWVDKLNYECQSKNKQFGPVIWKSKDIEFDPVYDNSKDCVRNYCYQSYKSFELCYACKNNLREYISMMLLPERIRRIDEFLSKKFPNEYTSLF